MSGEQGKECISRFYTFSSGSNGAFCKKQQSELLAERGF